MYVLNVKKVNLVTFLAVWSSVILVFLRLLYAELPFSYDYPAYLNILASLTDLTFAEIIGSNLLFPYTVAIGVVPVEFGFALFVKIVSLLGYGSVVNYALIASLSVGIRLYAMLSLRVPLLWSLWLNIIAITLLEANALRLGLATSILLLGLSQFYHRRHHRGVIFLIVAQSLHLQLLFFVLPVVLFLFASNWMSRSRLRLTFTIFCSAISAVVGSNLIYIVTNQKVAHYLSKGGSDSAGLSLTSVLAVFLVAICLIAYQRGPTHLMDRRYFAIALSASVPSIVLLIILTNVAVIGDRAWQLAAIVLSSFFFLDWCGKQSKQGPRYVLMLITTLMMFNVVIRYPLSNFFSPLLPVAIVELH